LFTVAEASDCLLLSKRVLKELIRRGDVEVLVDRYLSADRFLIDSDEFARLLERRIRDLGSDRLVRDVVMGLDNIIAAVQRRRRREEFDPGARIVAEFMGIRSLGHNTSRRIAGECRCSAVELTAQLMRKGLHYSSSEWAHITGLHKIRLLYGPEVRQRVMTWCHTHGYLVKELYWRTQPDRVLGCFCYWIRFVGCGRRKPFAYPPYAFAYDVGSFLTCWVSHSPCDFWYPYG